jgi:hypothetical protein
MESWIDVLTFVEGFDWDEGNLRKNYEKHGVTHTECEEVFFNNPFVVRRDEPHSAEEDRYFVLGKTDRERRLFIVFTIRNNKIRIVSARNMSKKERKVYEQIEKDTEIQD